MKKLFIGLFVSFLVISGCEKPESETEDVFRDMGLFGEWSVCNSDGSELSPGQDYFWIRIVPKNKFEVDDSTGTIGSCQIKAHSIDPSSCYMNFYPYKGDKNFVVRLGERGHLMKTEYISLSDGVMHFGLFFVYDDIRPEINFYFKRME